jgi:phosphoenolpyruvate-protein kinase (PTS system EI component)
VVPDELDLQLRAICRAAGTRRVSIMVPMVTTLAEVRAVKQRLGRVLDDLRAASPPIRPEVRLGVMIEVPAAAIATGRILDEVDFVSVGSNDLLQYFMASDRDNERTVDYLDPENEEFLWLLGEVARQAWERGRETDLSICGELASQPKMISRLLDLGFRCLSISPVSADAVRSAVASSDVALPAIAR